MYFSAQNVAFAAPAASLAHDFHHVDVVDEYGVLDSRHGPFATVLAAHTFAQSVALSLASDSGRFGDDAQIAAKTLNNVATEYRVVDVDGWESEESIKVVSSFVKYRI